MAILGLSLLFAGAALAHSGLNSIIIDGTSYPPFDSRVDDLIGPVRRIEWSHDIVLTPYNPVLGLTNPAMTCQPNPRAPLLKATARAGAEVTFKWSQLVRMHQGPVLAYMAPMPNAPTKAQNLKFFKIYERGFDSSKDKWANEIAADNNNTYTVQIPSDIKAGTYVLRTELIALHPNIRDAGIPALPGPEFYPYCFNIEVIGDGTATPEGVTFPGGYKNSDSGLFFAPYHGTGSGVEKNSKFVIPGPPLYKGKFDKPTGSPPVVKETGAYTGALADQYKALVAKLEIVNNGIAGYVNSKWEHYTYSPDVWQKFAGVILKVYTDRAALMPEINAFKAAAAKANTVARRFVV